MMNHQHAAKLNMVTSLINQREPQNLRVAAVLQEKVITESGGLSRECTAPEF
jgi:hypothetical protein